MTPTRAYVTRCCASIHGSDSVSPSRSGWSPAFARPAASRPGTSSAVTGPYATRPSCVATSTMGSSHIMPREPLRTTRTPGWAARAAATSSAPAARAAASRGTNTVTPSALPTGTETGANSRRTALPMIVSIIPSSTPVNMRPPVATAGPCAHKPRQKTSSISTAIVAPSSSALSSVALPPREMQASARHTCTMGPFGATVRKSL